MDRTLANAKRAAADTALEVKALTDAPLKNDRFRDGTW